MPALASAPDLDLEGHLLAFRRIGAADGVLATIVHVPDLRPVTVLRRRRIAARMG